MARSIEPGDTADISDGTDKIRYGVSADPPRDQVRGNGAHGSDSFLYKPPIEGFKSDNPDTITIWIDGSKVDLNKLMQKTAVPIEHPAATRTPAPSDAPIYTGVSAQSRTNIVSSNLEDTSGPYDTSPDYQIRGEIKNTWEATLSVTAAVSFKSERGVLLSSEEQTIYPLSPNQTWVFVIESGAGTNDQDVSTADLEVSRVRELPVPKAPEYLEIGKSQFLSSGAVASSITNTSGKAAAPYVLTKWFTDSNELFSVSADRVIGDLSPGATSPFQLDGDTEHFEARNFEFRPYDGTDWIDPYINAGYYRS